MPGTRPGKQSASPAIPATPGKADGQVPLGEDEAPATTTAGTAAPTTTAAQPQGTTTAPGKAPTTITTKKQTTTTADPKQAVEDPNNYVEVPLPKRH